MNAAGNNDFDFDFDFDFGFDFADDVVEVEVAAAATVVAVAVAVVVEVADDAVHINMGNHASALALLYSDPGSPAPVCCGVVAFGC